ncbi:MAG TPA: pyridoxine 5'-phosphate synthase [Deltaproteobacteria bacterium]|nr:pyridoxine 5'-phosphate synthase [Deltaproteobacteria bacterium]
MPTLSVNVDHVATVRQARLDTEPDPVAAAYLAELAGADGITVHLREDRRHIQDRDLRLLRETIKTELNLEMAAVDEMGDIAVEVGPDMATLVPERRAELTTEGGLDVDGRFDSLKPFIARLRDAGIRVNLFIDADRAMIERARALGADGVEIHTGPYAERFRRGGHADELERIADAAALASSLGLAVHAGHGLDFRNVRPLLAVREITGYAIGFSIVARSIYVGMEAAVREMARIVKG